MDRPRVVVVGGGPAGIATALFLAHADPELTGHIRILEKERYPREKFCAGAVGARADRLLASIGVVVDVPSVPIGGIAFRALGKTIEVPESGAGRVVRRIEFDHALSRVAVERGIALEEGVRVERIECKEQEIELSTSAGLVSADIVVGADGAGSFIRRALKFAPTPFWAQAIEVDTEPVASELASNLLLFDVSDRSVPGYYWEFPTLVGGRRMVCRGVYYLKTRAERPIEIRDVLARQLAARGLRLEHYRIKRYAERGFHGGVPLARPRVLLVGEAAGIDPVTGEGIAQAVQYGAVAGRYLAQKIRERDLGFQDFPSKVRRTMIGRDLLVRTAALPLFYGPHRPNVEAFLLDTPEFIRIGLQHFAGRKWSRRAVARGTWGAVKATVRATLGA